MDKMEGRQEKKHPHVLIFSAPAQGHINLMLTLARLLCLANFRVTFLNFDHIHDRLLRTTDVVSKAAQWPGFHFTTISDGLPPDHPRGVELMGEMFTSIRVNTKPLFKEMLISYRQSQYPLTCVIVDGLISTLTIDAAVEVGIPIIAFRTSSACSIWCYSSIPQLIEAGEIPFGEADMDKAVRSVRGMENILRLRDLPGFCRAKQATDPLLQILCAETLCITRAYALIVNTLEDMEGPILSHIHTRYPNTYAIGPLHALLRSRLSESGESNLDDSSAPASLWEEDRSCMKWLDSQPPKSVLYVSFGSLTHVNHSQLLEFWYGLVNSQTRFLWVIRPDMVKGTSEVGYPPEELKKATQKRGFLVEWAPQKEVLGHPAVGGFLTHSGWNSTLESVLAGVPMICWPFLGDQLVNSRYVEQVWKIGVDMKDTCERGTVERMVRKVMNEGELKVSTGKMAERARKCVSPGGSSYLNLDRLIDDIRQMALQ